MQPKLFLVILSAAAMCACQAVSFMPPQSVRKVAFPLRPCEEDRSARLQAARQKLTSAPQQLAAGEDLEFSDSWVCVTGKAALFAEEPPAGKAEAEKARVALANEKEKALRTALETPFLAESSRSRANLGIALSGGGSKAGAFAIGVLAGLADADLLDTADYISSVSGGSYAAYFYYTHRILPRFRPGERDSKVTTKELFWDCVQRPAPERMTKDIRDKLGERGACDEGSLRPSLGTTPRLPYVDARYQSFLRCQQDVFNPGVCSRDPSLGDYDKSINRVTLAGTLALIPVGWISNVLFDWGVNTSQAAHTYRRGIGMAYGTTLTHGAALQDPTQREVPCDKPADGGAYALDCKRGRFLVAPYGMNYQELRTGLLESRKPGATPMPFWIINATGPRYRSAYGWWSRTQEDTSNLDMFEMTAVSHGSGRFGYVSAPMSLHGMDVLDSVAASAAFADSSQLAITNRVVKGVLGVGIRLANFDWGSDIANYNVSDWRRELHKGLPAPLYWTDSGIDRTFGPASKPERRDFEDRAHTAYIRLIDGGNAEDLGVYALMKRQVKTLVIADSASDSDGHFGDVCAFAARLRHNPPTFPTGLYIPGLADLQAHCDALHDKDNPQARSYPVREWKFHFPVLMGCLRVTPPAEGAPACEGLDVATDSRVLLVKPAIDLESVIVNQTLKAEGGMKKQVIAKCRAPEGLLDTDKTAGGSKETEDVQAVPALNCDATAFLLAAWIDKDGPCQTFPQHGTAKMTVNSSAAVFSAYRELGRQYLLQAKPVLDELARGDATAFEAIAKQQAEHPISDRAKDGGHERKVKCDADARPEWLSARARS
jgi:hypothetical protein